MDNHNETENRKHKFTQFLERNEIWFKTVLSLAVTIAAFLVSLASYNTSRYQAQLAASVADSEDRSKQPFFSIVNYYDEKKEQYIYGIINTGGQIRYSNISIHPYLYIYQYNNERQIFSPLDKVVSSKNTNESFIYLPSFYISEPETIFTNGLVAFSDVWLEIPISEAVTENDEIKLVPSTEIQLADDYFQYLASSHNIAERSTTFMSSQIVYLVEITYYNYKNQIHSELIWLNRTADSSHRAEGNPILSFDYSLDAYYQEAVDKGFTYTVDSLNEPIETILNECENYIGMLFEFFNQVPERHF